MKNELFNFRLIHYLHISQIKVKVSNQCGVKFLELFNENQNFLRNNLKYTSSKIAQQQSRCNEHVETHSLNAIQRSEVNNSIKQRFRSIYDFVLTSFHLMILSQSFATSVSSSVQFQTDQFFSVAELDGGKHGASRLSRPAAAARASPTRWRILNPRFAPPSAVKRDLAGKRVSVEIHS